MKALLAVLPLFVWFSALPQGVNRQDSESLNRSLQDMGESFRRSRELKARREQEAREYELRKQQAETDRKVAEEQIKTLQVLREKAEKSSDPQGKGPYDDLPAAQAASDAAKPVSAQELPPSGRFQLISTSVNQNGHDQALLIKMDTVTGRTWELTRAANGSAFWQEVSAAPKHQYTAQEYDAAAKAFDADGKKDFAELARQRARELRSGVASQQNVVTNAGAGEQSGK